MYTPETSLDARRPSSEYRSVSNSTHIAVVDSSRVCVGALKLIPGRVNTSSLFCIVLQFIRNKTQHKHVIPTHTRRHIRVITDRNSFYFAYKMPTVQSCCSLISNVVGSRQLVTRFCDPPCNHYRGGDLPNRCFDKQLDSSQTVQ